MLDIHFKSNSLVNYKKNINNESILSQTLISKNPKVENTITKDVENDNNLCTQSSNSELPLPQNFPDSKASEKENIDRILFTCDICLRTFKLRMALEHHKKKAHKKNVINHVNGLMKLDLDEKSKSLHKNEDNSSKAIKLDANENSLEHDRNEYDAETLFCDFCNQKLRSEWFRPSERHKCQVSWFERKCKDASGYITEVESEDELNIQQSCKESGGEGKRSISRLNNQKAPNLKRISTPSKRIKSRCQICKKYFDKYSSLKTHYTQNHYWSKLSEQFGTIGNKCYICNLEFPTLNHLVLHMGNFHSKIDGYLLADGYKATTCESTIKLLDLKCGICGSVKKSSTALKYHLSTHHFSKELNREFPSTTRKTKKCAKCNKMVGGPNSFTILMGHLGGFHDEVLKYAYNSIVVSDADRDTIPINDFEDNIVGTTFSSPDMPEILSKIMESPKRKLSENHRKQSKKRKTNNQLNCQICDMTFVEYSTMKTHYTKDHFWSNLDTDYANWVSNCNICQISFPTSEHLLQHMGNFHTAITLDRYLGGKGKLPLTVEWTAKIKNLKCSICDIEKKSSALLKSHLAINHFSDQLNREFPAGKGKSKKCWKCSKVFSGPGSLSLRTGHLGSFHDEVLKYAAGFVEVDEVYRNIIPINDFEEVVKTISFRKQEDEVISDMKLITPTKYKTEKERKAYNGQNEKLSYMNELDLRASPTLDIFELDQCYLCDKKFFTDNPDTILEHMSYHYKLELRRKYIDRPGAVWPQNSQCQKCNEYFNTADKYLIHIGVIHKQVLQFIPERLK